MNDLRIDLYIDRKSVYVIKLYPGQEELIRELLSSEKKMKREIPREKEEKLKKFFSRLKIPDQDPALYIRFRYPEVADEAFREWQLSVFGATIEVEEFDTPQLFIRGKKIELEEWRVIHDRLYVVKKNPVYLFVIGEKSHFKSVINEFRKVSQIEELDPITWTIEQVEKLADRDRGRTLVKVNAPEIRDRRDGLNGAMLKSNEDIRDADWYPDVRNHIEHVVVHIDGYRVEIGLKDGKLRSYSNMSDREKISFYAGIVEDMLNA